MVRARIWVDGGLAAVCRCFWGRRWRPTVAVVSEMAGEDTARGARGPDWREFAGTFSLRGRWDTGGRAPSGREWNGSQPGQGATDLLLPWPTLGKMQGQPARGAGEPSGQGEDPSSERLGGHDLLTQADTGRPAGQVVRHHLYRQPGPVGGESAGRQVVQPDAVLEVAYRILNLGVAARWFSPTPYLRSRIAFSISAWRRWSASSSSVSSSRSVMKP